MKIYNYNLSTKSRKIFDSNSPLFATRISIVVSVVFSIVGIYLGITEDSLAVQINGLISAVDILYSFIFITAVKQSMKSPDYAFNYGYGKYESLFLLGAGSMLTAILSFTLYDTVIHFSASGKLVGNRFLLIGFSAVSAIVMLFMHFLQKKAALKHKMPSLEYDAQIWRVDSIIEFGVIGNLLLGLLLEKLGYSLAAKYIDSSSAIMLVGYALVFPIRGAKAAFNQLLDRTADEDIQFNLLAVIAENINNFCEFKAMHTRQSGKDLFIELDVVMPYDFTMEQKYEVEQKISSSIKEKYSNSIPRLYVIPCQKDCIIDGKCTCPVKNRGGLIK